MKKLSSYNEKRNFLKTSEPKGTASKSLSKDFMIHFHDAKRLHFDLRLQWQGVLLSWAVPKGPSFDPKDKRLAVKTEDHPVEYKSFEGVIPEVTYGAGPSMMWDVGTWRPLVKNVKVALEKGHLKFYMKGIRLRGIWNLIKMKGDKKSKSTKSPWLLVKEKDKYAIEGWSEKIKLDSNPNSDSYISLAWQTSVATGRQFKDFVDDESEIIETERNTHKKTEKHIDHQKSTDKDFGTCLQLKPSKFPKTLKPQLATLTEVAPLDMKDWTVEHKYDGYRILAFKKKVRFISIPETGTTGAQSFYLLKRLLKTYQLNKLSSMVKL